MKFKFFYNAETFGWVTDNRALHFLALVAYGIGTLALAAMPAVFIYLVARIGHQ